MIFQRGLFLLASLAFCQFGACAPKASNTAAVTPSSASFQHSPGATLHDTRSNQDGSLPERVLVHVVSPSELAVAKMVGRCTDAALVTAR
ncbi:MAG: hypothetical protein SGJ21_13600 [Alphaproteobacteria bacterium]|nr:hypothetical protein [Alphaproteobacteria bacterium]